MYIYIYIYNYTFAKTVIYVCKYFLKDLSKTKLYFQMKGHKNTQWKLVFFMKVVQLLELLQ